MVRQLVLLYSHSGRTQAAQPSFAYIYYADVNIVMSSAVLANAGASHSMCPQNVKYNIFKRKSALFGFILFALQLKIVSTSFCIAESGEPHCAPMRTFHLVSRRLALTYEPP